MSISNISPGFPVSTPPQYGGDKIAITNGGTTPETKNSSNTPVQAQHEPPVDAAVLESANTALKAINRALEFSVDPDTHKLSIKLLDTETGEVIREFPSTQALAISRSIELFQQVFLLKQKA